MDIVLRRNVGWVDWVVGIVEKKNYLPGGQYFKVSVYLPQMTIILRRRFTVRRLTQTPVKYIFSESSIIVDYEDILVKRKNRKVFQI